MILKKITSWKKDADEIILNFGSCTGGISFVKSDIVRFRFNEGSVLKSEETFVVEQVEVFNKFRCSRTSSGLSIKTSKIRLTVHFSPFCLSIDNNQGKNIFSLSQNNGAEYNGGRTILRCDLSNDERIYGLGQDPMANLNQRGKERRMWNEWGGGRRSGNNGIPFYLSSRGYAVLLNSSWPSRFAIAEAQVAPAGPASDWAPAPWPWDEHSGENDPNRLAIILDHNIMDIFIICRSLFDDLLEGYVVLTGHAPLPPKWALGFIQCKNRYRTQQELLSIAKGYRSRGIPCDVVVIDWLWFKKFGDLRWYESYWPNPKAMCEELEQIGIKVMQAQHPFVDRDSLMFEKFNSKGYLNKVPDNERPTFDHSNPEAREAWWNEIRNLYNDGIRGYWTDMGELEVHKPNTMSYLGPRERVHNIYSSLWTKGLFEGQKRDFGTRVFSLARASYAGIQRYGAALWSNDIDSSWEVLHEQVVIGQGVCLSGQQYWTTDIGGFFSKDIFDVELFIRWFQWGVFCPIFRTHGTRAFNEAWEYGTDAEKIIVNFIKLRYRLLPYIYSLAYQVTQHGRPIMRAMCIDFPNDPVAVEQTHQFMFGPSILVAPITSEKTRLRKVYLPKGTWYDFWTGEKLDGPRWITAFAPLTHIPLYIRGGSIIPMAAVVQHTAEKVSCPIELHVYPGKKCRFELYNDDGLTYEYEKGVFTKIVFEADDKGKVFLIDKTGNKALFTKSKEYEVILHSEKTFDNKDVLVQLATDTNLKSDGRLTIHATLCNLVDTDAIVKATVKLPYGWRFEPGFGPQKQLTINKGAFEHLMWEAFPAAEALPLLFEGSIDLEITVANKKTFKSTKLLWGSGYAGRFSIAGCFWNGANSQLEANPDLLRYQEDDFIIPWTRNPSYDFNCFGYTDCRLTAIREIDPQGNATAYAKCRVWSDVEVEAFAEVAADWNIKLWINGAEHFEHNNIIVDPLRIDKPITLRRGWNSVLIRVQRFDNGLHSWSGRELGFRFRFVDASGKIIPTLLYAA